MLNLDIISVCFFFFFLMVCPSLADSSVLTCLALFLQRWTWGKREIWRWKRLQPFKLRLVALLLLLPRRAKKGKTRGRGPPFWKILSVNPSLRVWRVLMALPTPPSWCGQGFDDGSWPCHQRARRSSGPSFGERQATWHPDYLFHHQGSWSWWML